MDSSISIDNAGYEHSLKSFNNKDTSTVLKNKSCLNDYLMTIECGK
jgi:predicted transcriptional regulator